MNSPRIVPAVMVAGLAVAAALVTANFITAAEEQVGAPGLDVLPAQPAPPAAPGCAGASVAFDAMTFASCFAAAGSDVHIASGAFALHIVDSAVIRGSEPASPYPREMNESAMANVERSSDAGKMPTNADSASEAARNAADLDALFAVAVRVKPAHVEAARSAQGERGKQVYMDLCFACHQPDGRGLPGTFPTLAKSDYMAADRTRAVRVVLEGLAGPVTVNGETINSVMPAQKTILTDQQIADVLTYVFNAWENPGGDFTANQVETIRREKP